MNSNISGAFPRGGASTSAARPRCSSLNCVNGAPAIMYMCSSYLGQARGTNELQPLEATPDDASTYACMHACNGGGGGGGGSIESWPRLPRSRWQPSGGKGNIYSLEESSNKRRAWFDPGSNRGPSACEADVITTTPPNHTDSSCHLTHPTTVTACMHA